MKPIRYRPYAIIRAIGSNTFELDLPPHLGIHPVLNVDSLKLYEPPSLENEVDSVVMEQQVDHPAGFILDFQPPLSQNVLFDTKVWETRHSSTTFYLVGKKGKLPTQARWYSKHHMETRFPHLAPDSMGTTHT